MAQGALQKLLKTVEDKKKKLDNFRPLPPDLLKNLQQWLKIETTYTSNALEGNTLTSSETALIIEKGLTIDGKSLQEHLEAINHADAFDFILQLASEEKKDITLTTIRELHQLILKKIDDNNAGKWRTIQVKIAGSDLILPEPFLLPDLMNDFISWLHTTTDHPVMIAADAHIKLVAIHPFVDGNGRTARLLMNLLLLQTSYPPLIINPEQRKEYIDALNLAHKFEDSVPFYLLMFQSLERSLDMYLEMCYSSNL